MADTKQFPDRLVAGSDSAFVSSSTAAELKFNRNLAIEVAADCLVAPSSTAAELKFSRNLAIEVAADCLVAPR